MSLRDKIGRPITDVEIAAHVDGLVDKVFAKIGDAAHVPVPAHPSDGETSVRGYPHMVYDGVDVIATYRVQHGGRSVTIKAKSRALANGTLLTEIANVLDHTITFERFCEVVEDSVARMFSGA